jgi:site-specific DNA-methyltransferase (cytosine-N4-specific)
VIPTLLRADAGTLPLSDESVDLIVTSPPYFGLRSYQDGGEHYTGQLGAESSPHEFVDALIDCTREMVRVLKPTGSIFVNLGDKYSGAQGQTQTGINGRRHTTNSAATWRQTDPSRTGIPNKSLMLLPERYRVAAVDEIGLIARAVLIWSKPNGLPESVRDRARRAHEDWVHLTKEPRYYSSVDEIREPSNPANLRPQDKRGEQSPKDTARRHARHGTVGHPGKPLEFNPRGKLPGSVWEIPTQPLRVPDHIEVDHFAAFPMEWPRRLIKGWCPPGGVVLDPFGGTGTTALVATMLGRTGISVDLSADYGRLAAWRCSDPKERARAAGADASKAVIESVGQASLFENLEAS